MSEGVKFLERLLENRIGRIHTAIPCKVERVNGDRCDVQPLFKRKRHGQPAQTMPLLSNVPILKRKRKIGENPVQYAVQNLHLEAGDIVLVSFSERSMDRIGDKRPYDPEHSRKHSLEDGVVVGVLLTDTVTEEPVIHTSTADPTNADGKDGDLWFVYE